MICTVKEGRYHGRRVVGEILAVIAIVITQPEIQNRSRFNVARSTGILPVGNRASCLVDDLTAERDAASPQT